MNPNDPREIARVIGTITVDCDRPQQPQVQMVNCEKCHQRYAIHCPDCKSQLTGCACTLAKKRAETEG